jgi:hypothetical protein
VPDVLFMQQVYTLVEYNLFSATKSFSCSPLYITLLSNYLCFDFRCNFLFAIFRKCKSAKPQ